MVLKKTNCDGVNSGNTMRRRYFTPLHQKYQAQTTHVIKYLHNIQLVDPNDGKTWEVDAAEYYFDDGGLAHSGTHCGWIWTRVSPFVCYMNKKRHWQMEDVIAETVHDKVDPAQFYCDDGGLAHAGTHYGWIWTRLSPFVCYSMNKKRCWLLEDVIADAVHDKKLAKKPFKVTLVRRAVPCYELSRLGSLYSNVTHYYDSHMPARMATSNHAFSLRQSLLQKGSNKQKEELDKRSKRQLKRCQGHNQHFRDLQRKVLKKSSAEDEIGYTIN